MGKRSKRILIGSLAAVLATLFFTAVVNFGWLRGVHSALSHKDAELRFPYQQLSKREQALYGTLYHGIENYDETIRLPGIYSKEEYEHVYLMLAMQEPQFFYLSNIYETADQMAEANMHYRVEKDQIAVMRSQMDLAADRILKQADTASGEMQRMQMIHDGVAALCEYSEDSFQSEAYGCLVNGRAKCEGYSKALLYVARRGGINIMNVPGTIRNGENHVWNVAQIEGKYYNFDVTWDDDEQYRGNVIHSCFAVPDDLFLDHHPDLTAYRPPTCSDGDRDYYKMNNLTVDSADALVSMIRTWPWSGSMLEFRMTSPQVYAAVREKLKSSMEVQDAVKLVSGAVNFRATVDETRNTIVILPS